MDRVVLLGVVVVVLMTGCGSDPEPTAQRPVTTQAADTTTEPAEADVSSGESCISEYSAENLAARSFAFDGTAIEVRDDRDPRGPSPDVVSSRAVFEVHRWFGPGTGETVRVWMQREVVTGDRLLVTGEPRWGGEPLEDAIAWECGYTSTYSNALAAEWAEARPAP